MKPLSVLYVIWALERGGAEQVVAALASGLDSSRFQTAVCCLTRKGELTTLLEERGIPVIAMDKKRGFDRRIIGKLRELMKEREVDVVHTHLWTANFWGRLAARLARAPVVVATEHNIDVWKTPLHFLVDRQLARITSRIVYVSDAVESFYVDRVGIDRRRGQRIYNGIDTRPFRRDLDGTALSEVLGLPPGARIVTTIGRLVPQKGHRVFIDTMEIVSAQYPAAVGLIVGGGECREDLEQYLRDRGLEGVVRLLGLRSDIPQLLGISDVFVLASFREGFPITILEAMAVGLPCVVTDVGGNREAVEREVTGFVVPTGDAEALAEPIVDLLRNEDKRREMSRKSYERIGKLFSIEKMVAETESLYENLCRRT